MYRSLGIFIEPSYYPIDVVNRPNKEGVVEEKTIFGVSLSLEDQLKTYFNIPGIYEQTIQYEAYLKKNGF